MELRIYDARDGITKLGPGVRFGIWVQGCQRRCPGCMTPDSRPLDGGRLTDTHTLAQDVISSGRTGVTISGGEPFLQATALGELISEIRQQRDVGVIVYTGYTYEQLRQGIPDNAAKLLDLCDMIIDGEYIDELNDGKNHRGSSNQRAIPLTDRYAQFASEVGTRPAEVEFFYDEENLCMIGVPPRALLEGIKKKKL